MLHLVLLVSCFGLRSLPICSRIFVALILRFLFVYSDMKKIRAGVDQLAFAIDLGDLFEQEKGILDLALAMCLWAHWPVKGALIIASVF